MSNRHWGVLLALVGTAVAQGAAFRVAAYGDSVTRGFPYSPGDARTYPSQLDALLAGEPDDYTVINRGINGLTSAGLLDRFDDQGWLALDQPDVALLKIGGNDFIQSLGVTTQDELDQLYLQIAGNVQSAVSRIKSHVNDDGSTPLVILSAFIPNTLGTVPIDGVPKSASVIISEYNDVLETSVTGVDRYFTSNFEDFFDPQTLQADATLMGDPVHPNPAGYAVIAENFREEVLTLIPEPHSAVLFLVLVTRLRRGIAAPVC